MATGLDQWTKSAEVVRLMVRRRPCEVFQVRK